MKYIISRYISTSIFSLNVVASTLHYVGSAIDSQPGSQAVKRARDLHIKHQRNDVGNADACAVPLTANMTAYTHARMFMGINGGLVAHCRSVKLRIKIKLNEMKIIYDRFVAIQGTYTHAHLHQCLQVDA